jgi:hypothetical protein
MDFIEIIMLGVLEVCLFFEFGFSHFILGRFECVDE